MTGFVFNLGPLCTNNILDRRVEKLLNKGFYIDLDRIWMDEDESIQIDDGIKRNFLFGCFLKNEGGVEISLDTFNNETFVSCDGSRVGLISMIMGIDPDFEFECDQDFYKEEKE